MPDKKTGAMFTINMFKTFEQCPRKYFYLYEKNLSLNENSKNTLTGNKLHNLINYHLKGHDVTKLLNCLDEKERQMWKNFLKLNLKNNIESEYSFTLRLEDFWLTGRIDAIFKTENKYLIADWKTSDYILDEKEQFQAYFYLFCLYEILGGKGLVQGYEDVSLKFFILSSGEEISIDLTKGIYENFKKKIRELCSKISSEKIFESKPNQCKNCNYTKICGGISQ